MNFIERIEEIKKLFALDDPLGIRWRTEFGIRMGLERMESYKLALALAGVN